MDAKDRRIAERKASRAYWSTITSSRIKVKQKISGGFSTLSGAQVFAITRTFLSTMRKQGVNLFQAILNRRLQISRANVSEGGGVPGELRSA